MVRLILILFFLSLISINLASATVYDGTKAGVMLTFEHATSDQLPAINSEMMDIVGTIAPLPTRVGTSGHMTQQQLLDLQSRGFEIASHSETHSSISSSTSANTLFYETVQSKIDLENMGFIVNGFIQPSNKMTTASFDLIKNNYKWTSFFSPLTYQPLYMTLQTLDYSKTNYGIYHEYAHGVGNSYALNTFAKVKEKIDFAIANKYLIAFKFHGIKTGSGSYLTSPTMFKEITDYLKQQRDLGNLVIITRSQGTGYTPVPDLLPPVTTASPVGGNYTSVQSVSLIVNEPAVIYYTNDGTDPSILSFKYATVIPISATTTLKYFGVDTAGNMELPKTNIYNIIIDVPVIIDPITHMSDTTSSSGQDMYSSRPIHAEYVSPTSQLIGDKIDVIKVKLKKSGSPTGLAEIGIFNSNKTVKQLFTTKDVSTLTTAYTEFTFVLPSGTYQIQSGDRIGVKYEGGNSSNSISIMRDTSSSDPFDGSNSYHVYVQGTTWSSFTSNDLTMTLIQTR